MKSLINSCRLKICILDPLPASIMNDCTDVLLPVLTKVISISTETANVPVQLKEAMIRPKLKKESLDHEVYSNFRPISNLKFISKMIQKAVSYQLTNYLRDNDLEESLQSAYKTFHSTETALVKAHNDIVSAIDNQAYIILLLLDLSAAFDTVDHKILLQRLSCRFGINGKALRWLKSYLENRKQVVNVKGATSCSKDLRCGVPQGSVLGPILYVLYASPLGDIVRSHGLSCHLYADDTQIYCSFKLHDQAASVQEIESCLNDIDAWILANMLKLNRDRTELPVIGPKHKVNLSNNARNIGVIFDSHVNLEKHVMNTCKTAFYHLQNIAKIRNCLSQDNAETLVHAFISSKLDFCNALLYGLPQSVIDRLQYVQNCAARLVNKTRSSEHTTPVLRRLHWLPVRQRITYKILLLTYKALNSMAPKYIADLLQPYTPTRQVRSSSKNLLVTPKSNLKFQSLGAAT